jgi:hypothetical protein
MRPSGAISIGPNPCTSCFLGKNFQLQFKLFDSGSSGLGALPIILILLGFFITGCNGSTSVIGDPKVVDPPTPVTPGTNVSISVDVTSAKPVSYQWKTDEGDGKIIKGETSSAVVWQAPQQPGLYNVYLQVTIDNVVTEKSVAIEVADEAITPIAISTPSPAELTATLPPHPLMPSKAQSMSRARYYSRTILRMVAHTRQIGTWATVGMLCKTRQVTMCFAITRQA